MSEMGTEFALNYDVCCSQLEAFPLSIPSDHGTCTQVADQYLKSMLSRVAKESNIDQIPDALSRLKAGRRFRPVSQVRASLRKVSTILSFPSGTHQDLGVQESLNGIQVLSLMGASMKPLMQFMFEGVKCFLCTAGPYAKTYTRAKPHLPFPFA